MFNIDDILKGYSSEQYSEAILYLIVNFLKEKGMIDMKEFMEYHKNNLNNILEQIVERDRKIAKEKIDKMGDDK